MLSKDKYVRSVIDLGTNTCLLLIASVKNGTLTTLHESLETPRIGKGIYDTGRISEESFHRALEVFRKYRTISEEFGAESIDAFGTSALRDAKNRDEFIEFIESATDIEIKVISGAEEAECSYLGATYDLNENDYAVIDIGGGSTEISFREYDTLISESADAGSVRLTDKFFRKNYDSENLVAAGKYAESLLGDLTLPVTKKELVGVAGTVTTLAAVKLGLKEFDAEKIHGAVITQNEVESILKRLASMNEEERLKLGTYMNGRSDIITAGVLILHAAMKKLNAGHVTVSTKGLRYGLMLRLDDFSDKI